MPSALWTLLLLHFRGVLRRVGRGLRTPRGIVFLILGILVMFAWLVPTIYGAVKVHRTDAHLVRTAAPFAILAFCFGNLIASFGENAVAFTAAEVDFLFAGPFSRRSLLGFKIIKSCLGTIFTSTIFTVLLLRYSASAISCFIGVWLTVQFMQLFAIAVVMIGQTVGERIYGTARRSAALVVAAIVVLAAAPQFASGYQHDPMQLMQQVHATIAGRILLAPFDIFARAFTAANLYPQLAIWGGGALLIDLTMVAIVVGLDANYLETAAAVSQRRYERIRRARRGGAGLVGTGSRANWRVRPLPWLGGAGPIVWRQLVTALRSSRNVLVMLVMITVIASVILSKHGGDAGHHHGQPSGELASMLGMAIWINLVFVAMLRFDFRDELDRMDVLRSLPLRPAAVAAAELVAPILVLTALQLVLLVAMGIGGISAWSTVLAMAAFTLPFNFLLAGIENLLFLMFPLRAAGMIAGDMQLFGRQMVVFFCKFFLLISGLAIAAAIGTIGYILGGESWPTFAAVMWVALWLVAMVTVPLLARAFSRFDPSVDTPA